MRAGMGRRLTGKRLHLPCSVLHRHSSLCIAGEISIYVFPHRRHLSFDVRKQDSATEIDDSVSELRIVGAGTGANPWTNVLRSPYWRSQSFLRSFSPSEVSSLRTPCRRLSR